MSRIGVDDGQVVPAVSPELPSSAWKALLALLGRLPQGALSRGFGALADFPIPRRLRRPVLTTFARALGADLEEAELPVEAYVSLNLFFTRRLRAGAREWPADPAIAASPVDGTTGELGRVGNGRALQAKGRWYSITELLQDDDEARRFDGGSFVTLYLAPRDYHRIHAPTDARIHTAAHVPGSLLPVNAPAVAHIADLFVRNERLLCYLDGPFGRVALVAVGAYNVGRISAAFDDAWNAPPGRGSWVTNRRGARAELRNYYPPIRVRQGEELMTFHLGSTVVLLFEPERMMLRGSLAPGQRVRLGEPLGRSTD